ncbi:MAG: DUF3124 domain-containing protein [Humidesulfovibrio sp.]
MIRRYRLVLALAGLLLLASASVGLAEMSTGQTLYVPCSSHTYHGPKTRQVDLTVTLVVRNADTRNPITLNSVDYYGTNGKLLRRYLARPTVIEPLSAQEFMVEQNDTVGGAGASFLLRWRAAKLVNEPVVEAVMIGSSSGLGISFVSHGVTVQE